MATVGRKPKPSLAVVREGNPGHRPVRDAVKLPPSALIEPKWSEVFPGPRRSERRARAVAATHWRRLAPTLSRSVGLTGEQQDSLVELCITLARIDQGERALSMQGVVTESERGSVKNPWTTVLNQYRSHFRSLAAELGLTPSSLARVGGRGGAGDDDEDDPFDS
ncbi:phage terminase small subunit P27 family [Cellulomonas palmilytica]|uniref:phage terminase small subunit P27 family n=1 Tax=Cellulomonas palmilytica TaxID=2608402 RepID=UPI001F22EC37|nr:phage terminase small subunit P27 family [Cellulomonas palmilytica]UJP39338.1 phage terminase small subunit P27 family [Cellulomonas palmilytica]